MSKYEDGSYGSLAGIALIGKVLAGRCEMKYTRAAVGNGAIPDDKTPKTMTDPAGYVMDCKIAAVTTPVDGECQVTVQIKSDDVENGFYATGIVLYAEDPDEGEVPYTYLVLENEPEWIRPASSIVGKLATFDIIAAVGDVDAVAAIIDPEAVATVGYVQQVIAGATVKREITIPTSGWETGAEETDEGVLYLDLPQEDVTEDMVPIISILPAFMQVAYKCGLFTTARTVSGAVRLYAASTPAAAIDASLTLLAASNGRAGDNNASEGTYILPTASTTRLGGVRVKEGSGLAIDSNGYISIDAASASDVSGLFDKTEL